MKTSPSTLAFAIVLFTAGSVQAAEAPPLATNVPVCIELHDQYDSPQRLAFPATLASRWMPGLFPERAT